MKGSSPAKNKPVQRGNAPRWIQGQPDVSKRNPSIKLRAHGAPRGKNPRGF